MNILKRCTPAFILLFIILSTGLFSSAHAAIDDWERDEADDIWLCKIKVYNRVNLRTVEEYTLQSDKSWERKKDGVVTTGWTVTKDIFRWFKLASSNSNGEEIQIKVVGIPRVFRQFGDEDKLTQYWGQRHNTTYCS